VNRGRSPAHDDRLSLGVPRATLAGDLRLAKTSTFLLRYFADRAWRGATIGGTISASLALIVTHSSLAAVEGSFAFVAGRLAAYTAEALRDGCAIFSLITSSASAHITAAPHRRSHERVTDVDSVRKFFSEEAIDCIIRSSASTGPRS
jgi:hypothetical protein